MDKLVEAKTITIEVEEKDTATCTNARMMELNDEDENKMPKTTIPKDAMMDEEEEGMKPTTPRIEMGYNDLSNTHREVGSIQFVHHKER
jgi:hypothetical protein